MHNLLNTLNNEYFNKETEKEIYLPLSEDDFMQIVPGLLNDNIVLIGLFCAENFEGHTGFTLFYVLEKRGARNIVIIERNLDGNRTASVAEHLPSASWFEREITDGFGIEFENSFDKRRLFLHEAYPDGFHPLLKSFKNSDISEMRATEQPGESYVFKEMRGEGVYQIPVGPVHAGIIEPGHFRFSALGETITNLEIRMFYKHRGIEKLAEGKKPLEAVVIAETISGDESAANAFGYCNALEKISGAEVPKRAVCLRTILLEMERIYSHLGDLGGMLTDVAFAVGASDFMILREEILRHNQNLTGSRFLKGLICPGGLKKDIAADTLKLISIYLDSFKKQFDQAVKFAHSLDSVIDRFETTGIINKGLVNPLNITGPAARASGAEIDNRTDHPYGLYSPVNIVKHTMAEGDVLCRFDVKAAEIFDSIEIIRKLISEIRPGIVTAPVKVKDGYTLSIIEAPRGQTLHWLYIKNGLIDRYKIRTASFCNWQAIEHAVMGNIVPDFPLINKSLNLSYAGTDL